MNVAEDLADLRDPLLRRANKLDHPRTAAPGKQTKAAMAVDLLEDVINTIPICLINRSDSVILENDWPLI